MYNNAELKRLMEEFIEEQGTFKDEWWASDKTIAKHVLESFADKLGIELGVDNESEYQLH